MEIAVGNFRFTIMETHVAALFIAAVAMTMVKSRFTTLLIAVLGITIVQSWVTALFVIAVVAMSYISARYQRQGGGQQLALQ